jgi:CheY-like chemotaxis protein
MHQGHAVVPLRALITRIKGEYTEMAGLRLTIAQACRLWQLDPATCEHVMSALVNEGFLVRTKNRASVAMPHKQRRAPGVLLVDGAADNRAMYAESLRAAGFRAIEIDNTADALALAVTADAIVTEIRVPGPFDGLELVRRLRADARTRSKPTIVLTACAFAEDRSRARAAGCDVFLPKPCVPAMLIRELVQLLGSASAGSQSIRAARRQRRRGVA